MAPVAIESGKRRNASFRWACDKRLRSHVCVLADSTRHWHPLAKDVLWGIHLTGASSLSRAGPLAVAAGWAGGLGCPAAGAAGGRAAGWR